jgi:hypothetical protein
MERIGENAGCGVKHPFLLLSAAGLALTGWVLVLFPQANQVPSLVVALGLSGVVFGALGQVGVARIGPRIILLACLFARLPFALQDPGLSDDVYRYVHEARAQKIGLATPYNIPPAQVVPEPRDGLWSKVAHPEIPAAYPPFSQMAMGLVIGLGDLAQRPVGFWRAFIIACDLFILSLLGGLFRRGRKAAPVRTRRLAFYGLHPLPLWELVGAGHLDGLGILMIALATASGLGLTRPALRGAFFGLAAGVKPFVLLFLPFGVPGQRRGQKWVVLGFFAVIVACALPYLLAGANLFSGMSNYAIKWRSHPFAYVVVDSGAQALFADRESANIHTHAHLSWNPPTVMIETGGQADFRLGRGEDLPTRIHLGPDLLARAVAGALLLFFWFALVLKGRRGDPRNAMALCLLAFVMLTPTVHPWYLAWLLPLGAMRQSWAIWFFSAFGLALHQTSSAWLSQGQWVQHAWPRWTMLLALVGLGLFESRRLRSAKAPIQK